MNTRILLPSVIIFLSTSATLLHADSLELLSLSQGKPSDAKSSPVISLLKGWLLEPGPPPSLVLPADLDAETDSQSAQCTITLSPDLHQRAFTLTFTAEITGGGWIGVNLRGSGPVPQPWISVGRGALGHANAQTSNSERMDLPRSSASSSSTVTLFVNPNDRTFSVSFDGATPTIIPLPENLDNISSISFSLTAKNNRAQSASISNVSLTY